jgi:hypothetical protein
MRKLLREPLLHFLVLGVLLFAVYSFLSTGGEPEQGRIVVTEGQVASLATTFARTWQRMPTQEELQGLVDGYVREEVLYREGLLLGLDRDDPVIRRRVVQKLQFIEEGSSETEPTEADLQAYFESHRADFELQPRYTFRQVFLDPGRRGAAVTTDAERLLAELTSDSSQEPDIAALGDPTLLPLSFDDALASEVSRVLGAEFAEGLATLVVGPWQGPLRSTFGWHLVQLSARQDAAIPELAEVRAEVEREWQRARRMEASEAFYRQLLLRYKVVVEMPEPEPAGASASQ